MLSAALVTGCAGPQVTDYAAEQPVLDLRQYFNGTLDAYGLFTDRSGKVVKRFTGTAGDVVGEAAGQEKGNAFRWGYTLKLPVDGRIIEVQFDDWMYLMGDKVMLNKAKMSKFGFGLGEVTLSFVKR